MAITKSTMEKETEQQRKHVDDFEIMLRTEKESSFSRKVGIVEAFCGDIRSSVHDFYSRETDSKQNINAFKSSVKERMYAFDEQVWEEVVLTRGELDRNKRLLSRTKRTSSRMGGILFDLLLLDKNAENLDEVPVMKIIHNHLDNAANSYSLSKLMLDVVVSAKLSGHISQMQSYMDEWIKNVKRVTLWSKNLVYVAIKENKESGHTTADLARLHMLSRYPSILRKDSSDKNK